MTRTPEQAEPMDVEKAIKAILYRYGTPSPYTPTSYREYLDARAFLMSLQHAKEDLTRQNKKLRHEIRVLHLRLADANRGAERIAWENYELRRQVDKQAQEISALRAENKYFRERMKEERP